MSAASHPASHVTRHDDEPELDTLERAVWRADHVVGLIADDVATRLADVLADLRHWASARGVDFDESVDASHVAASGDLDDWLMMSACLDTPDGEHLVSHGSCDVCGRKNLA
ncbi:hypothetical protein [Plantibacter sp. CFBP 8804]|uniref:hypothetical protein n=1 Tax=Plantibacter sp. CFBP 8804 TaxID=2775270 RepID=UPI0017840B33|nr:hypothetical protein [Plantibacter sp. CFBP 8804]MBD8519046.1 hypothetical protein [Plantibacter sp. CFBP 8804]